MMPAPPSLTAHHLGGPQPIQGRQQVWDDPAPATCQEEFPGMKGGQAGNPAAERNRTDASAPRADGTARPEGGHRVGPGRLPRCMLSPGLWLGRGILRS